MSNLTGRALGRYENLQRIAHGGTATVYKAFDPKINELVAIKVLLPGMAENEQFSRRFRREANLVLRLRHPNIIPIRDFGEEDGYAYLVMPYLNVGTLTDKINGHRIDLPEMSRWVEQICDALDFAHQKGVVHRDVKPSNILLDHKANALVSDFGLAHIHDTSWSLTGSGLIGTPNYMSPEQSRGDKVDGRSDQYSFGIILFQLVTGQLPYEAESPVVVLMKHMNEPLPSPRSINPSVPESIERIILKATAKNPAERFASMAELNVAFQATVAHTLNPELNPEPDIPLPQSSPTLIEIDGINRFRMNIVSRKWLRFGAIGAGLLVFLLAVPVLASNLLSILEQASSPAQSSGRQAVDILVAEGTALAATIESLPLKSLATPVPSETAAVSSVEGLSEDFESEPGAFLMVEGSEIVEGGYHLGPFEHCAADEPAWDTAVGCTSVCLTCDDEAKNFQMDLEISFVEGLSEGDYGVILRFVDENGDMLIDREDYLLILGFESFSDEWIVYSHLADRVEPWQVIRRGVAGLRAQGRPNRLEVISSNDGRLIDVFLNDFRLFKLTADPPQPGEFVVEEWEESGAVGFIVLGRRVVTRYDNFNFQPILPEETSQ